MLTGAQIVMVAEITQEEYATIDLAAPDLTADQESVLLDDLDTWETIRDSHVKVQGGSDGIDYDNERKREAIRQRVRKMFGLPLVSYEVGDPMQFFQLEVGQNFG